MASGVGDLAAQQGGCLLATMGPSPTLKKTRRTSSHACLPFERTVVATPARAKSWWRRAISMNDQPLRAAVGGQHDLDQQLVGFQQPW
jgi:hypothetical protein